MTKLAVVVFAVLCGLTLLAMADPTVLDTSWRFSGGSLGIEFTSSNDAKITFSTGGYFASGSLVATDYDDNPYKYNVDTTRAQVKARVEGGGYISFRMDRLDSWTSMYGAAGQYTYTQIWTYDGAASFATNTRTNYADMITHNYGFQAADQYTASGTDFEIYHEVFGAADRYAGLQIVGSGSAIVTLMSDEARASGWKFGEGAGCYTNANAVLSGSGLFWLYGTAPNSLKLPFNLGTIPGGSFNFWINYQNLSNFKFDNINSAGS